MYLINLSQPELYCKSCGALIPDNKDRESLGEGSKKPALLACKGCAILAGGRVPPDGNRKVRMKIKDLESLGQERFDVPVLVIR